MFKSSIKHVEISCVAACTASQNQSSALAATEKQSSGIEKGSLFIALRVRFKSSIPEFSNWTSQPLLDTKLDFPRYTEIFVMRVRPVVFIV